MTESEVIEILRFAYPKESNRPITEEVISIAINALEEIQQYKELGTVEALRVAKEKQIPKKPHKNFEKFSGVWCSCGKYLGKGYFVDKPSYCTDCGQKLDWSDEE